jgi:hypothetical protein
MGLLLVYAIDIRIFPVVYVLSTSVVAFIWFDRLLYVLGFAIDRDLQERKHYSQKNDHSRKFLNHKIFALNRSFLEIIRKLFIVVFM